MAVRGLLLGLLFAALGLHTSLVFAGVERHPNAVQAQDLECDNGFSSPSLLIIGRTGHTLSDGQAGVAMKVEVLTASGWVTLVDVPGGGLDTALCTFTGPDGAQYRAEVLFRGNLR